MAVAFWIDQSEITDINFPDPHDRTNVRKAVGEEMNPYHVIRSGNLALLCFTSFVATAETNLSPAAVCPVQVFSSALLGHEDMFHGIGIASDGNVYLGTCTHDLNQSAQLLRFSPGTSKFEQLADMGELTQTPVGAGGFVPQGKIHTPFFENDRILYFATHVAVVSQAATKGLKPYPGGWFVKLNLENGECARLGSAPPGEGIVTVAADFSRKRLYGLTYPSALLLILDLSSNQIRNIGSVGGEQYHPADQVPYRNVCRSLGVDPSTGRVYGSREDGSIFYYDPKTDCLADIDVNIRDGMRDLNNGAQSDKNANWRSIRYDAESKSFYAICSNGPWLLRFNPAKPSIEPLGRMAVEPVLSEKNPTGIMATLAFDLTPNGMLYQITRGVPLSIAGRPPAKAQAHLVSYDLRNGRLTDHGALYGGDRRVLDSQSMTFAADGTLWAMAYIESFDTNRPVGDAGIPYERALIRVEPSTLAK